MARVEVSHIKVLADRVIFDVQLSDDAPRRTNAAMAARALAQRPAIARHTCINSVGPVFGDVIERTPIPHLMEHLCIDILVELLGDSGQVVTGTSEWLDAQAGQARVAVSCPDDLLVLQSFNETVRIVNDKVLG